MSRRAKKARCGYITWTLPKRLAAVVEPRRHLLRAINLMVDRMEPPPCITDDGTARSEWTSELREELRYAQQQCFKCPLLQLCRTVGKAETSGVWGGVARSRVQ